MSLISYTPNPLCYAVIFTTIRTEGDDGYDAIAEKMVALATPQPGYLGRESARDEIGITVSYWKDLESIKNWKMNAEHLQAQRQGREKWYSNYKTRVSLVERDYGM